MTFYSVSIEPEHFYLDIEIHNYLKIHPKIQQICEKKIELLSLNLLFGLMVCMKMMATLKI